MDKEQLRAQLEQLHAELQQVGSVDDNDRETLQKLARDIQGLLEREDDPRNAHQRGPDLHRASHGRAERQQHALQTAQHAGPDAGGDVALRGLPHLAARPPTGGRSTPAAALAPPGSGARSCTGPRHSERTGCRPCASAGSEWSASHSPAPGSRQGRLP